MTRIAVAGTLLLVGLVALVILGGQVAMCLGPLGVTAVQCAKATGIAPSVWLGAPIFAALASAALITLWPVPRSRLVPAIAAAVLVGGAAGFAYSVLRARTMEGLDSRGVWISVDLPLDLFALSAVCILAAAVGLILGGHLPSMKRRSLVSRQSSRQ